MKSVKTAKGRVIDMSALAAKHEKTRAVSNYPLNARGDIIDSRGKVKVSKEKISKEYYKDNVPGADTTTTSIKEEPVAAKEAAAALPIEISRVERERADGTKYFEVEYSDGSMEEIDV